MPKTETLTVTIDDWKNWDGEKNWPLRFTATRTDKNEVVELVVFKSSNYENDPAENIREHLASINPGGYVGTVQNVTVKYTKEHQGIRQFYLYDMEAVEGANEAPEQPSDPKPVVTQDIFAGIDPNQLRIMRQQKTLMMVKLRSMLLSTWQGNSLNTLSLARCLALILR